MANLLTLFRRANDSQGIRQSTALTTVYLLEMNRKFESFMRDKVEELEGRVAAQQARLSTKIDAEAGDWEAALLEQETIPADELGWEDEVVPIVDETPAALPVLGVDKERELTAKGSMSLPAEPQVEPEEPAAGPDYMTLLIGTPSDPEPEPAAEAVTGSGNDDGYEDQTVEEGTVQEGNPQDGFEVDSSAEEPEAAVVDEDPPPEEGISALDLLAQGDVDDTVPWFVDEQATAVGKISAKTAGPTAPPDIPETDAPVEAVEKNEEESEPWDARLPAEGQKGAWT